MSFLRGQLCEVATHGFAVADLDSSMDRGLSPKRAINLPPAFLTPSIQEYHIRNCLTFKKHTNLWSLEETQRLASTVARRNSASRFYGRSKKLSVSLLWSLEETQRLASMVARRELSVSYIELVLFKRLRVLV
ncbi:hypothetical protein [Leptospira interrogans]|uniref:hypothetical protein n=1 Tax=Leptospira interrogans TaxID=173 RepID=UPI001E3A91BC|nr:hypothetical protein [Leptospira interrogans]